MQNIYVVINMKNKLYLENLKNKLNDDFNERFIFEESQTGPQEEPILLQYDVDISKFREYLQNLDKKRDKC